MVINRIINGMKQTISLTDEEIEKAFRERDAYYKDLDIKSKILEMIIDEEELDYYDKWSLELPEESESTTDYSRKLRTLWENSKSLTEEFIEGLGNNDGYWESYWITAEYIIEDELERM